MKKFNFYSQLKDKFSLVFNIGIITIAFALVMDIYDRVADYKHHAFVLSKIFSDYHSHQIFEDIIFYSTSAIITSCLFYLGYKHDKNQEMIFNLQKEIKVLETQWQRLVIIDLNSKDSQKTMNTKLRIFNNVNRRLINKLREVGGSDPEISYFLEIVEDDISGIADDISGDDFEPDALIPLNCLDCKYYSNNNYIHCLVHPNLETDCPDFEVGEQIDDRYITEDQDEIANRLDWTINLNYITAVSEENPDSKLIICQCNYPFFLFSENYQCGDNQYLSSTYFTCSLSDNNRQIDECPNCGTHLL